MRTAIVSSIKPPSKPIRKGDLVRLNPRDETMQRHWQTYKPNTKPMFHARRPATNEEQDRWTAELELQVKAGKEPWHDSGGEPRLAPRSVSVYLPLDGVFIVERARCRVQLGWGAPTGGMTRILNTQTGEHAYVPREMLEVIK